MLFAPFKNFNDDRKGIVANQFMLTTALMWIMFFLYYMDPDYANFGPSDDFVVVGVKMNTNFKYWTCVLLLVQLQLALLVAEEFALPVFDFTVYNPTCATVENYRRLELQYKTNVTYSLKGFLKLIKPLVLKERLDVLFILWASEEIASVFTVHNNLSQKYFPLDETPCQLGFGKRLLRTIW